MSHEILRDKQQNNGLVRHLQNILQGTTKVKGLDLDSPLVEVLKSKLDGKLPPVGQQVEKESPFLPRYNGEIPPIYQAPSNKQKERNNLTLLDKFYLANQRYSNGGKKQ